MSQRVLAEPLVIAHLLKDLQHPNEKPWAVIPTQGQLLVAHGQLLIFEQSRGASKVWKPTIHAHTCTSREGIFQQPALTWENSMLGVLKTKANS